MITKNDLIDPSKWTADPSQMECRHECGLMFVFEKPLDGGLGLESRAHNIEVIEGVDGVFDAALLASVARLAGEIFNEAFTEAGGWDEK